MYRTTGRGADHRQKKANKEKKTKKNIAFESGNETLGYSFVINRDFQQNPQDWQYSL